MKQYDVCFTSERISQLKKSIGKKFIKLKCDPFEFLKAIYGIVGIVTDVGAYSFTNMVEVADFRITPIKVDSKAGKFDWISLYISLLFQLQKMLLFQMVSTFC